MSIHSSNKQEALEAFDGKLIKRNSFGGVSFRMRDFANSLENNIERLSKLIESSNLHEKYYQTYLDIIQKTQNSLKENDEHLKNICAEDDIKDFDNREKFFESLKDSNWNKIYLNPDRLYKEKILTNMQRSREFGIQTRNIFFTTEKVIWSPPFLKPKDTMFFIKTETFSGKDSDYRKITDIICGNVFDSKLLKKDIPSKIIYVIKLQFSK